ncbi:hypothetical protein Bca4012_068570 [Brassica carinata]
MIGSGESEETEDKQQKEEETVKVIIEEEIKERNDGKSKSRGGEGKKEAVVVAEAVKEEEAEGGNRVMVVVDKALASTGALEWAITHTLQPQDTLFLLYFAQPFTKDRSGDKEARRKDKEKGATIVEEAKKQQVSLLVVGQEKKPPVWRLLKRWAWKRRRGHAGVLKYCLENATCMTIAVKPKKRKHGGYLITTKRHKTFWLLA